MRLHSDQLEHRRHRVSSRLNKELLLWYGPSFTFLRPEAERYLRHRDTHLLGSSI